MNNFSIGTIGEMLNDFDNGVYNLTDNGKCTGCGACCSNILPMSNREITTIKRYIKKHGIKEQKHLIPMSKEFFDMTCPFLDSSKTKDKCTIYPVRPQVCRQFICDSKSQKDFKTKEMLNIVMVREEFFGRG